MPVDTARFPGHQSFTLRNTWLTKGVWGCAENGAIFREPDALVTLGVGKNMVESIRYWCIATRVIEEEPLRRGFFRPSVIGEKLFVQAGGWDPYLEDSATLWLLHWLLATHAEVATTIYYAFNELTGLEFSRDSLNQALLKLASIVEARVTPNTLRRDNNVFIRSYAGGEDSAASSVEDNLDCPLVDLGLLYEERIGQTYAFVRGPKDSLPDEIFLYALGEYAQRRGEQSSLTFDELAYFPCSPGRVFKLDEAALGERLERVTDMTQGKWQLTETAGYRQMTITENIDTLQIVGDYYARHSLGGAHA